MRPLSPKEKNQDHLLSEHVVSPLVTISASSCRPSRQIDKSPIVSVGSLSPTSCKVTTTSSTEREQNYTTMVTFLPQTILTVKNLMSGQWLIVIILATQKADIRRTAVQSQPGQIV
jgi:hypothetical protein